ncbi:MAG: ComEC family competence protein [Rhodobacteraceae bacterium]|nr:ComEC family competence protein [Paracoccaceae bacterium]
MVRLLQWPFAALLTARGSLFAWVPILVGCGVALWFALPWEPGLPFYAAAAAICALAFAAARFGPDLARPMAIAAGCLALGVLACGLRVQIVQAPVLAFRYYGPIQGRIIEIDRSQSDALRLTLDQVVLDRVAPDRTPRKVRVSLHDQTPLFPYDPGQIVMMTGHLDAPQGPVEPGGFDFARMAWFEGLGAVGYTRNPVMLWQPPAPGAQQINRLRTYLSNAIMTALPGDAGAFASGVMTGDRSGLSAEAVADLRDSSLAHLLAISGMNMAFLTAFVFALIRYGVALIPPLALRVNAKKLAAIAAFAVALFYLGLSGANVATERAFIMVCVMLGAVMFDRRAMTLRSVSLAGLLILLWQPEALLSPGFQMSFAATVALIAGFALVDQQVLRERLPRLAIPVFMLVLSSVVAGFATAPYAAAHFNRYADYGLLANLLTVPVMGAVVMPAGAVAAVLAPFGLAAPALWVMEKGAAWILFVAGWIAGLDGAVTPIVDPGPAVLALVTLGGAWLVIWQGWLRVWGAAPLAVALLLWVGATRPDAIIDADGRVVGLIGPEGRALSAPRGAGFAVKSWLENDGDLALQAEAALRPGFEGEAGARAFTIGRWRGIVLTGRGAADRIAAACATHDLVVLGAIADTPPADCLLLDQTRLALTGPLAITAQADGLHLIPTHDTSRIWRPEPAAMTMVWQPDGERIAANP